MRTNRLRLMKILSIGLLFGYWAGVSAQTVPSWLDPNASVPQNAEAAKRENVSAANATRELIRSGIEAPVTVQSVIKAYGDCDSVVSSVAAALEVNPEAAPAVANAAAALGACPCSGEDLWSRTRFNRRIQTQQAAAPYRVPLPCACPALVAEAATRISPSSAERVLAAVLGATQPSGTVADSIGQLGSIDRFSPDGVSALVRKPGRECVRDENPSDAFVLDQDWQQAEIQTVLGQLGSNTICADSQDAPAVTQQEGQSETQESPVVKGKELRIVAVISSANNRAILLENSTDEVVDLEAEGYLFDVHFQGLTNVGYRLTLSGEVPAKGRFLVAAPISSADILAASGFTSSLANFRPVDALVLRRSVAPRDCGCGDAAIAGVANGLEDQGQSWYEGLEKSEGSSPLLKSVDRVGRVRPESQGRSEWQPELVPAPMEIVRKDPKCLGDSNPEAEFNLGATWQVRTDQYFSLACEQTPETVLISNYSANKLPDTEEVYRSIRIANFTPGNIDLKEGGYVLELYAKGDRTPMQSLSLDGDLAVGASMLLASPNAPSEILQAAAFIDAALADAKLDAAVLRRVAKNRSAMCPASPTLGVPPIVIATSPSTEGASDPRTDDIVKPEVGGPVSPN